MEQSAATCQALPLRSRCQQKHPLALPGRIADWGGSGPRAFEDFLVRRAYESSVRRLDLEERLPSFTSVRKIALLRRQVDLDVVVIRERSSETSRLRLRNLAARPRLGKRSRWRKQKHERACRMNRTS